MAENNPEDIIKSTSDKFKSKVPKNADDLLKFLEEVDERIKSIPDYLDDIFSNIENCPQEMVDFLCEKASNRINYMIEYQRIKVLNNAGPIKKMAQDLVEKYAPPIAMIEALEEPTPDNIVKVVASIIPIFRWFYDVIYKPYKKAIETISELTERLLSIANSLQRLASYTPPKANDINFDKFHIHVKIPTINELASEGNLPYPAPPGYVKPPKVSSAIKNTVSRRKDKHAVDGDSSIA